MKWFNYMMGVMGGIGITMIIDFISQLMIVNITSIFPSPYILVGGGLALGFSIILTIFGGLNTTE